MSDIYKISEAIGITSKAIQNVTNEQIERKMTHCLLKIRIGDKMYEKDEESQMRTRKKLFWLIISISYIDLLFRGYLRQGKRTEALELLQGMRDYGCVPLASSYTQIMQHLFTFDQYEAACELYEEMQEIGGQPDIVTTFTAEIFLKH